jgi:hypothetical protein
MCYCPLSSLPILSFSFPSSSYFSYYLHPPSVIPLFILHYILFILLFTHLMSAFSSRGSFIQFLLIVMKAIYNELKLRELIRSNGIWWYRNLWMKIKKPVTELPCPPQNTVTLSTWNRFI